MSHLCSLEGHETNLDECHIGVFEVPTGIGHGAENVLRGCLQKSVPLRWTIDMVDDVAWGVGWGEEGDVTGSPTSPVDGNTNGPAHHYNEYRSSRSRSRARPYPDHLVAHELLLAHNTGGYPEEPLSAISSSSGTHSQSRSRSRAARAPSLGRHSVERNHTPILGLPSLKSGLVVDTTGLRGRRLRKSVGIESDAQSRSDSSHTSSHAGPSTSRSPSPSAAPPTPPDVLSPTAFRAFDGSEVDQMRGRTLRNGGKSGPAGLSILSESWGSDE